MPAAKKDAAPEEPSASGAEAKGEEQATAEREAQTIPKERLIEEADAYLGHPPHVAAGALHGVEDEELTVDQAKERVDDWLAQEVE